MHPLSWNIYGGHIDNVKLLLENGANVNDEFDSMNDQGPVTALDVVLQLRVNEDGDDRFVQLESILRQNGAKTMKELQQDATQSADNAEDNSSDSEQEL